MYQGNAAVFADTPHALTHPGTFIHFPDEWRAFVERIPPEQRGDMRAAYKAIFDMTPANDAERRRQIDAAVGWSVWEGSISNLVPVPRAAGQFGNETFALCAGLPDREGHYFGRSSLNSAQLHPRQRRDPGHPARPHRPRPLRRRLPTDPSVQACRRVDGGRRICFVWTTAGHSAMEGQNVLALTAIMDGLGTGLAG